MLSLLYAVYNIQYFSPKDIQVMKEVMETSPKFCSPTSSCKNVKSPSITDAVSHVFFSLKIAGITLFTEVDTSRLNW